VGLRVSLMLKGGATIPDAGNRRFDTRFASYILLPFVPVAFGGRIKVCTNLTREKVLGPVFLPAQSNRVRKGEKGVWILPSIPRLRVGSVQLQRRILSGRDGGEESKRLGKEPRTRANSQGCLVDRGRRLKKLIAVSGTIAHQMEMIPNSHGLSGGGNLGGERKEGGGGDEKIN